MLVQRAYKTELDLNQSQVSACKQHAGAARFAYNWGLARRQEAYRASGKSIWAMELHRELNARKHDDLGWLYAVSKCAPQEGLRNLDSAFRHFFRRCQLKKEGQWKGKLGYPKLKSKKQGLGSFRLTGHIHIFEGSIQLPRLGRLRLKENGYLPTSGVNILSATISEEAGHWYISLQVAEEREMPVNTGPVVGVDLGLKALATLSDGTVIPNPRHLKQKLKKIKRLHRRVSRRKKGSKNRKKAVQQLRKQYRKVRHQRQNTLHQVTTRLAKTKSVIVIENLNVQGMMKNRRLSLAIGDVGWYEFRRQLTYKAAWYGSRIVLADRWEPSSRMCSGCGWYNEGLTLSDRTFHCQQCRLVLDRDLNAARNLAKLAGSSSDNANACGVDSTGPARKRRVKLSTKNVQQGRKKQELDAVYPSGING
jgi:putative transposase